MLVAAVGPRPPAAYTPPLTIGMPVSDEGAPNPAYYESANPSWLLLVVVTISPAGSYQRLV